MPTGRTYTFLLAALLFYLFANQTQTGWLYVVAAVLGGAVLAGWLLNRGAIDRITAERQITDESDRPIHEGDDIHITLTLDNQRRFAAAHLQLTEHCVLAAPESDEREFSIFVPLLPQRIQYDYAVTVYRRGVQRFRPLAIASRAPFGFFTRREAIDIGTERLIYPTVRKLSQLDLLDRQPAAELTNPRTGLGSEVIGVRPYRPGDSPRHIHWRSVARRQQLISKEFAQETQPGVTIVLDRYSPLPATIETKHTPFEMAVKCAVSIAEYALRQRYPVYLAADTEEIAFPRGALVWDAIMQYMAKVHTRNRATLADVLTFQPLQKYVAVVLAWHDADVIEPLIALKHRGVGLLVVMPDVPTYPIDTQASIKDFVATLRAHDITVRVIQHGDDWADALSNPAR